MAKLLTLRKFTLDKPLIESAPKMKRILSLDGGGVRSFFTLQILLKVEDILRKRTGNPNYLLSDHFDLIAGTSAGAIIGSLLSWGLSVEAVIERYKTCTQAVFQRAPLIKQYKYHYTDRGIAKELRSIFKEENGEDALFGSRKLKTLLLLVMRNATTGSPWPLCNNPKGLYNDPSLPDCNLNLPLWQLIRASSAAPSFFPSEMIKLGDKTFEFIDGGVSPYNNPSFLAFQFATLPCYRLEWETGENKLFVLSVGTGRVKPKLRKARHQDMHLLDHAQHVVESLMYSCSLQQDFCCRTMAKVLYGEPIDSEIGTLMESRESRAKPNTLFAYTRFDTLLNRSRSPGSKSTRNQFKLDDLGSVPLFTERGRKYAGNFVTTDRLL